MFKDYRTAASKDNGCGASMLTIGVYLAAMLVAVLAGWLMHLGNPDSRAMAGKVIGIFAGGYLLERSIGNGPTINVLVIVSIVTSIVTRHDLPISYRLIAGVIIFIAPFMGYGLSRLLRRFSRQHTKV